MKILVTGGAGYIGSFVTRMLQDEGHDVVILDNLAYGHRAAVTAPVEVVDLGDRSAVERVFEVHRPDAVMHLAAWIDVNESVNDPAKYFVNNTGYTAMLLEVMARQEVSVFVFSSTAAVYGTPDAIPISESAPTRPESPYGLSKLLTEMSLPAHSNAYGTRWIALRYFNAAGAALDGTTGEDHEPATHLITNVIKGALGQKPFTLFGDDYPDTPDGTCLRDYIHVLDIAAAHVVALEHLSGGGKSGVFNVGTGRGLTNLEVVNAVKRISGTDLPVTIGPRRAGDPSRLVADAGLLRRTMGWEPRYSDLDTIVESSWRWQKSHPQGYGE